MSSNFKLVLKRKSGDNYEIKPGSSTFKSSVTSILNEINQPFRRDEDCLIRYDSSTMASLFEPSKQPKILINHSIPFPVALVEDKSNIVHTKALLFMHLFRSYAAPCIVCVLCKHFFSISEFTKHFHINDEDLSSDSELDSSNEIDLALLKQRKLASLRKKQLKLLPYSIGANNSFKLNEEKIKFWKLFTERFMLFKQNKQKAYLQNTKPKEAKFIDWEYSNERENVFTLAKSRVDNEKIVYLTTSAAKTVVSHEKETRPKSNRTTTKSQIFSLSDSESDNSDSDEQDLQIFDRRLSAEKEASISPSSSQLQPKESKKVYVLKHCQNRMYIKYFNYYDNLSAFILKHQISNEFTVVPISLIDYNIRNSQRQRLMSKNLKNFGVFKEI